MSSVTRKMYFTEGDTLPQIEGVYKDADGNVVDITDYTLTLNIQYATVVSVEATIVDGPSGTFKFEWSEGDLVAGTYNAEIEVTDDSGDIITASRVSDGKKFQLVIYPQIA